MIKIVSGSHLDHGLSAEHISFILETFKERDDFFAETVEMPRSLPPLECGLHGPLMGDEPVSDEECEAIVRKGRGGSSRMCNRDPRRTRWLTVVAGPHKGDRCVLFTAYGGKMAPREPWDPSMTEEQREESAAFWSQHALSKEA